MARITDQNRIERLKQSTMKLVVERGFGGASASLIAKDANVASGYFYMHYKGKYEMVNALLQDVYQEIISKFEELSKNDSTFNTIIENMIRHFFQMAKTDPIKIKFLYVLTNDYSFVIDSKMHKNIYNIIETIVSHGHTSGELDKNVTQTDLYLIVVIDTIQYINQKFKNTQKGVKFEKEDEDHLIYLISKILK